MVPKIIHGPFPRLVHRGERLNSARTADKFVAPVRVRVARAAPVLGGGKMPIAKLVAFLRSARTPRDKVLALSALRSRGAEAAVAVSLLITMLNDTNPNVRRAATDVLLDLCSNSAVLSTMRRNGGLVPALTTIVGTHYSWEVRSFALKVVVRISTPVQAIDILKSALANREWRVCADSLFYLRSTAILRAVKATGQEAAIARLVSSLLGHARSAVRMGAVETLAKLGNVAKASEAALTRRLGQETDGGIRWRIARLVGALNRNASPSAQVNIIGAALAKIASSDRDWTARACAAQALGLMGRAVMRVAIPALIHLIADGRRRMAHIKGTCMELHSTCDRKMDTYYDVMVKAQRAVQMKMGRGKAVWNGLIGLWSHDDEFVRYFSASLWANMFWEATFQNLPK